MDVNKEQELQTKIEQGLTAESADGKIYGHIFKALSREPDFALPATFVHQLMAKVEARRLRETLRDRWLLFGGLVLFLIGFIVVVASVQFKPGLGVYSFVQQYAGLCLFGILFFVLLHVIDKRYIKPKLKGSVASRNDTFE